MAITWAGVQWVATTVYILGARIGNVGNVYVARVAGSSGAGPGPTGTGSGRGLGQRRWQA